MSLSACSSELEIESRGVVLNSIMAWTRTYPNSGKNFSQLILTESKRVATEEYQEVPVLVAHELTFA